MGKIKGGIGMWNKSMEKIYLLMSRGIPVKSYRAEDGRFHVEIGEIDGVNHEFEDAIRTAITDYTVETLIENGDWEFVEALKMA